MTGFSYRVYLAAMLLSPVVNAAEQIELEHMPWPSIAGQFQIKSETDVKGARHSNSEHALQVLSSRVDQNDKVHTRMQQHYHGFPVFGGYAITHAAVHATQLTSRQAGDIEMNGVVYANLEQELGVPGASFVQNGEIILNEFLAQYPHADSSEAEVEPMVYVGKDARAVWAYKVSVLVDVDQTERPERQTAIIDAKTRQTLLQWDDIKTVTHVVDARGFGGNEKIGKHQFGEKLPYLSVTRDQEKGVCFLQNSVVKVVDMRLQTKLPGVPIAFQCAEHAEFYWTLGGGYDLTNGGYAPGNDVMYAGQVTSRMYAQWYGLLSVVSKGMPTPMVMRIHYGVNYANAFWNGSHVSFGDGNNKMHPLTTLDIVAHELSHGFTQQYSNLNYFGESGGMNESFSDMAAQAVEYYLHAENTWMIGAGMMKEGNQQRALRYLDKPRLDGKSIERANQYHANMDVHHSSGVYNRLFYLLSNEPGWNTRKAFDVMVKANMDYWTPGSTFEQGACGIISAATDLNCPLGAIKKSLDVVKIKYDKCKIKSKR